MMHGVGKSTSEDRESNDDVYCLAFSKPIFVTNYIHHNTHLSAHGHNKYRWQTSNTRTTKYLPVHLSCSMVHDVPTASYKISSPQFPVSSLFPKIIQQLLTSSSSSVVTTKTILPSLLITLQNPMAYR
jgi:hypothetical protein